jgi:hypothetical protein
MEASMQIAEEQQVDCSPNMFQDLM